MKKQLFLKSVAVVFLSILLVFIVLGVFLWGEGKRRAFREAEVRLETVVSSVNQAITNMMDLTRQDFEYLVENENRMLSDTLHAFQGEGMELFIVDRQGTLLVATDGIRGEKITSKAVKEGTQKAHSGEVFSSDLDSFLEKEHLLRVILLEKEYSHNNPQRVGSIYIVLEKPVFQLSLSMTLIGFGVVGLMMIASLGILTVWFYQRYLSPLQLLDEGASEFGKGNFSYRLPEKRGRDMKPLFTSFNEMAEKVEKNESIRQTFVSNVSHDLRTPLTTIGGFVQNMMEGTIPPEKSGHYYQIILDEVGRLSRLVATLLETGRMTSGERKYRPAPVDLCELGRRTLLSFEQSLEEKALDVNFESDKDSLFVLADEDAINQVIYNLLDNAIKFVPREGRISIKISQKEKKAFFAVTNSGTGIPKEELSHLFDRFYKSDRSRGLDKKGMGLGLFIAKTIMDAHKEEIWVESREGDYTRFVFSLSLTDQEKRVRGR